MPPKYKKKSDVSLDSSGSDRSALLQNNVVLEGELSIYQVSQIAPLFTNALVGASAAGMPVRVDMSAVSECDGAGLQLLLALSRAAHAAGLDVELSRTQTSIVAMLNTYGVTEQFVVLTESIEEATQ